MPYAPNELLPHDAMVQELMRPLSRFLAMDGATEIVVNRPCEVWVEAGPSWTRFDAPALTLERCWSLVNAIASFTGQVVDVEHPLLSAQLPDGQRVQIIVPPAADRDTISLTIRVPDATVRSFDDYKAQGFFNRYVWPRPRAFKERRGDLQPLDLALIDLLETGQLASFIELAVKNKKNIAFVGDTGSGKTSLMKSACQFIPEEDRIVTIEDVREIVLAPHRNSVHLLYAKNGQGTACTTPADLIAACMRVKPNRVLLAELRGAEAFDFLKLLTTGHSGSITSFHAESCTLASERYVFMCKEHPQAAIYDTTALKRLVALTIDIIIHIAVERTESDGKASKARFVSEIQFDPIAKLGARFGDATLYHA